MQALRDAKDRPPPKAERPFQVVTTSVDCVFFLRTRPPVDPVRLVRAICADAVVAATPSARRCRYLNRLTPVLRMGRATEAGIERVVREVLAPWFQLREPQVKGDDAAELSTEVVDEPCGLPNGAGGDGGAETVPTALSEKATSEESGTTEEVQQEEKKERVPNTGTDSDQPVYSVSHPFGSRGSLGQRRIGKRVTF